MQDNLQRVYIFGEREGGSPARSKGLGTRARSEGDIFLVQEKGGHLRAIPW